MGIPDLIYGIFLNLTGIGLSGNAAVVVKEFELSGPSSKTMLFTVYAYFGNLSILYPKGAQAQGG